MRSTYLATTVLWAWLALPVGGTESTPVLEGMFRPPDECGDPKMISQAYDLFRGRVVEVIDGDSLVIEWIRDHQVSYEPAPPERGPTEVQLVCLKAPPLSDPIGRLARDRLSQRLLSKIVLVLISPYQEEGTPLNVMIELKDGHDIDENVEQLHQGLARYREFGPYDIDWWLACHYKRAEDQARSHGRGIWE